MKLKTFFFSFILSSLFFLPITSFAANCSVTDNPAKCSALSDPIYGTNSFQGVYSATITCTDTQVCGKIIYKRQNGFYDCAEPLCTEKPPATPIATPPTPVDTRIKFTPQVSIPSPDNTGSFDKPFIFKDNGTIEPIGLLIKDIIKYLIGIAGILGTIMLMYGGFLYIISGGQGKLITDAQNHIVSAIVGIVLAATSYLILATVNTDLVNFKATTINSVTKETTVASAGPTAADCNSSCAPKKGMIKKNLTQPSLTPTCQCYDETTSHTECSLTLSGSGENNSMCIVRPGPGTSQCSYNGQCETFVRPRVSCCQRSSSCDASFDSPNCNNRGGGTYMPGKFCITDSVGQELCQ